MMYGFGDDQNPYTESVDLLEDLVIEFITEIVSCSLDFLNLSVGAFKTFNRTFNNMDS